MANSRDKSTGSGPKATSAGPKRGGTAKGAAAEPAGRPHLRAVEPAGEPSDVTEGAESAAKGEGAQDGRFRRGDLLEAVCARSPMKRSDAKVLLELVLDELGQAIERRDELILPPLGKLSVKRRKPEGGGADVLTLKLRRGGAAGAAKGDESPLADPDEDG
jgi:hypothetical protein